MIRVRYNLFLALAVIASIAITGGTAFAQAPAKPAAPKPAPPKPTIQFSPEERHIIEIMDERRNADSLIPMLGSSDERVARRAALGIANIEDTLVRAGLISHLLNESRPRVRQAELLALGILGPSEASWKALSKLINQQPDSSVFDAAGRATPKGGEEKLLELVESTAKESNGDGVRALLQLALRKYKSPKLLELTDHFAEHNLASVRWRAAYTFSRIEDSAGLYAKIERLKELLNDQGSADARMFAALAFGKIHNTETERILAAAYRGEAEWRVRTNIIYALGKMGTVDSTVIAVFEGVTQKCANEDFIAQELGMAVLTTIDQMIVAGKVRTAADSLELHNWFELFVLDREPYMGLAIKVRANALIPLARIGSTQIEEDVRNIGSFADRPIREPAIRAAGMLMDTTLFEDMITTLPGVSPQEQFARLDALDSMWAKAKHNAGFREVLERKGLAASLRHALIRVPNLAWDPSLVVNTLIAMEDTTIINTAELRTEAKEYTARYPARFSFAMYRDHTLAAISAIKWLKNDLPLALAGLQLAYDSAAARGDIEVMDSVKSAIAAIPHATLKEHAAMKPIRKIDWNLLETAPEKVLLTLDKGLVQITLLKDEAPLTCLSFIKLAQDAFFANKTIHRVVPNFVIQSGDPGGTGEGGPGYSIRREISTAEYDRPGILGMASSGKDTEGSQWFITHLPTPHLDTRYTVFGYVTGGMDAVNQTQFGDQSENIIMFRR